MDRKLKSAWLKLDNATKHIAKVNEILQKERPFAYILETNIKTRKKATFAKKNEAVVDLMSVACGDVFSNLRTGLDFGYFQIISAIVLDEKSRKNILKSGNEDGLEETIKKRFAHRVSPEFCDAIRALKPYGEPGGNTLLYALEKAAMPERHRDYTPVGDYTRIDSNVLRAQINDFPNFGMSDFGSNKRDVTWDARRIDVRQRHIGISVPGQIGIFEKELQVPVDVVFEITEANYRGPVIPTLNMFCDVVEKTLMVLEGFA